MSTEIASEAAPTPVLASRSSVIPGVILGAAALTTGLIAGL